MQSPVSIKYPVYGSKLAYHVIQCQVCHVCKRHEANAVQRKFVCNRCHMPERRFDKVQSYMAATYTKCRHKTDIFIIN